MLKLHTRTQQTPTLIVTGLYGPRPTLECVRMTERKKTLKSLKMFKFSAALAFLP
jgi:hypothetical protein